MAQQSTAPDTPEDAFRLLLSNKHLYQSITVAKSSGIAWVPLCKFGSDTLVPTGRAWNSEKLGPSSGENFMLPTINTYCATCKERWPFNPVLSQSFFTAYTTKDCGIKQCFYLTYECQNCKRDFVSFIVSRVANKIQLSGREPIEALPVPVCLPNGPAKYYSSGLIAHHAGQTLAGLFLLRVFVEQFWKSVPEVKALLAGDPRATGEKQGDAYQSTLPPDFKSRFPSLRDIYGKLSEAMHGAKDDANIFDSCSADIVEHFEARKLFKIK